MKRTHNPMLERLNNSKLDSTKEVRYTVAFVVVVTVWLTLDFWTKLADTL